MQGERLAIINDNDSVLEILEDDLSSDHTITVKVSSAKEFKQKFTAGEFDNVSVAIIDDKMPMPGVGEGMARKLKGKYPNITIVSFSSQLQTWGDVNLHNHPNTSIRDIKKAILDIQH